MVSCSEPKTEENQDSAFINLTPYSVFYQGPLEIQSPSDAYDHLGNFSKTEKEIYNFALTGSSLWLYTDLSTFGQDMDQLSILEPRLEQLDIYSRTESGWEILFQGGQAFSFHERDIELASFLVDLEGHLEVAPELLIHINNQTKRNIPVFLSDHEGVLLYFSKRNLINGLYFGLLFIMILYNSFVLVSVRDKNYLYYIIFLILIAFTQGHMMGLAQQYIFPNNTFLMIQGASIFAPMAGIAAINFIMHILGTLREMPHLHKALLGAMVIYSLSFIISFTGEGEAAYIFLQAGNLTGSMVVLVCAILSVMRGSITARFILLGWAFIIFGIISYVFTEIGLLSFNYQLSPHLVQIGSGVEILLFSFALADRINRYKEERLLAVSEKEKLLRSSIEIEKENNRKLAEMELSALRGQMNPHFVFNALGAIQYYIHTHDVELADDYLTKFALLMRKYLESSREKMMSVREELELLKLYTDLETLRFESKFTCRITAGADLDLEEDILPSMLIQPFVENSIKHGLNERTDHKGELSIHFSQTQDGLKVTITDNGIGLKKGLSNRSLDHQSRGMQIIKEKVNTLRESGLADVTIQYEYLYPMESEFPGTVVTLIIRNLAADE